MTWMWYRIVSIVRACVFYALRASEKNMGTCQFVIRVEINISLKAEK